VLSPSNPSTYSAMGFIHAIVGNTDEAVDAFHKALGLRRDDTFSTTMLSYVIEQLAEDTPPFQGSSLFYLLPIFVGANVGGLIEHDCFLCSPRCAETNTAV
jgi:hypothetical protein